VNLVAVCIGMGAALAATIPSGGIVVTVISLPLLVVVQQISMKIQLGKDEMRDKFTGVLRAEPWLTFGTEMGTFPAPVFYVAMGAEHAGDAVAWLAAIAAIRTKLLGRPLVGMYADGLAAVDPYLEPFAAGPVMAILEQELASYGLRAIVEKSVAVNGPDLRDAIDDAVRVARRRAPDFGSARRP
jgi:hypothetical protein